MNIRHALEFAEKYLNEGLIESAERCISYAESHLTSQDPDGLLEAPVICCFATKGNIIHCGKSDKEPLFPGTIEERVKLCQECRNWCREKIQELKKRIEERGSLMSKKLELKIQRSVKKAEEYK